MSLSSPRPRLLNTSLIRASLGTVLMFSSLFLSSCAIFNLEPSLPSYQEVCDARELNKSEWQQLEQILTAWDKQGIAVLDSFALVAEAPGTSLRVRALIQDIQFEASPSSQVQSDYYQQWQTTHTADNAYLAARIAEADLAIVLANAALELDPEHLSAKILLLGLAASADDISPLMNLVDILADHPECAEGWRLLNELAPFYARPDLAAAASEVEPWLPVKKPESLLLLRAECKLAAGEAERALALLEICQKRPGKLMRAKALVETGDLLAAKELLEELTSAQSNDPIAHFNLGLLAYEYLDDRLLAQQEFEIVMQLLAAGERLPVLQQTQCQVWLERLTK